MSESVVDRMYHEFKLLVGCIDEAEPSLRIAAEDNFRKTLLLAAASYFERRIKEDLLNFIHRRTGGVDLVREFSRNKAIERQYHTFFQWELSNANAFFGLFGESFKSYMRAIVQTDDEYRLAIESFLELGRDRNRLVHEDFGAFVLEKTTDEIFTLYQRALPFVESIPIRFDGYLSQSGIEVSE